MDEYGRRKFRRLRVTLLFLSAALVGISGCLLAPMCGGTLGHELLIAAGWELPVVLGGTALAGVFLFAYVERFMREPPPERAPDGGGSLDERDLVRKLVTTGELGVAERRALPNRTARASLACQAIVDVLSECGWFPSDRRPDQRYDGGLIERVLDGTFALHWKTDGEPTRVGSSAVEPHPTAEAAAREWLRRTFPRDIDGVDLDWGS